MMAQSCCHLLTEPHWLRCEHLHVPLQAGVWAQGPTEDISRGTASFLSLWQLPAALCSLDKFREVKFLKLDCSGKRYKTLKRYKIPPTKLLLCLADVAEGFPSIRRGAGVSLPCLARCNNKFFKPKLVVWGCPFHLWQDCLDHTFPFLFLESSYILKCYSIQYRLGECFIKKNRYALMHVAKLSSIQLCTGCLCQDPKKFM